MKPKDVFFYSLGALVVIGFFTTLVVLIIKGADKDTQNLLIGALIAAFSTVVGYFYGSSKGSQEKDELLANSNPNPPITPTP